MDNSGERWVTVAEAARLLGCSERTIRRWLASGEVAVDRTGPLIVVDIAGRVLDSDTTPADMSGELEALRAEVERLREVLAEVRSERDYLRQVHALAVSGEQRLLTEQAGERPRRRWRWRWPWQRGEG